ncbi:hypothetical protein Vretimale_15570, partial [Volvox reticuliferus]
PPPPPSPSPPSPSPPEPWRSIPSFGPGTLQPALGKSDLRWGRRWKPPSPPPPPPLQPLAPPAGPPGNDLQRSGDSDESLAAAAPMFPATWDARNKTLTGGRRIISSVKNQYSCNACVSFAVIAAAETAFAKGRGVNAAWVDFSEHRLFFCDSQQAVRPASCSLGWSVSDALAALQRSGVYLECCWNYLPGKGASFCNRPSSCSTQRPGSDCKPVPGRWVVQKVNWGSAEAANTSAAKDMVMNSGSAIACFREYADMTRNRGAIYRFQAGVAAKGYHCAQLIGWDDEEGYWLFKSSWGEDVGEEGFFKIGYGEVEVLVWGVYGVMWLDVE